MSSFLKTVVVLACGASFCAAAAPRAKAGRTPEEAEEYQYQMYVKRVAWMKEYERAEAARVAAAAAAAAATPEAPPPPQIDPAKLVVPQLRPLLEDTARRPHALEPRLKLARKYLKLRHFDLALATLDEGLAQQPDWSLGRLTRAQTLWQKGELDAARREYSLVVVSEPDWITPRFYRAHLLEAMQRTTEAIEDWETLAQMAQERGLVDLSLLADRRMSALRGQ
ncbi:hypothetical protein HS125_10025 [bacterium]|nr:hypothetical protein [bacterium]